MWLNVRGSPPYRLECGKDVTIGRGRDCEISLYSTLLSREHARIRWEGEQPVLFDLESLNGCFIGPDRIARHALRDGDVVRLGDIMLQFRTSERPPAPLGEELAPPFDVEVPANPQEPAGDETRLFSRTTALQQRVFEYDEIGKLAEETRSFVASLRDPRLGEQDLSAWHAALGEQDQGVFWEVLRLGIAAPRDPGRDLRGLSPQHLARGCTLTKRGERLRDVVLGKRVHWNEMASLRYRMRQLPSFNALRQISRAYRPAVGLREVDVPRLIEEVSEIYAPELKGRALELELRKLLCMGVLCPAPGAGPAAWYPQDWTNGRVQVAERGYAVLNGFRVEELP